MSGENGNKKITIFIVVLIILLIVRFACNYIIQKETNKSEEIIENVSSQTEDKNTNNINQEEKKSEENSKEEKDEKIKYDEYIGVWQDFAEGEKDIPEGELLITKVEENKIKFDFLLYRIASIENIEATMTGKEGTFNASDENVKGKIIFNDNMVTLEIDEGSNENIVPRKIEFTTKSDYSIIKGEKVVK